MPKKTLSLALPKIQVLPIHSGESPAQTEYNDLGCMEFLTT